MRLSRGGSPLVLSIAFLFVQTSVLAIPAPHTDDTEPVTTIFSNTSVSTAWTSSALGVPEEISPDTTMLSRRAPSMQVERRTAKAASITSSGLSIAQINDLNNLTNNIRLNNGVAKVTVDSRMSAVAQKQAEFQASTCTLTHTGANGADLVTRVNVMGIVNVWMAENVAAGQQTTQAVITAWQNSPGHFQNLINSHLDAVGYGMAVNNQCGNYKIYWAQTFAGLNGKIQKVAGT